MSIEAFQLVKDKMSVYVNLRLEKHGKDEKVNGYDIKVRGDFTNHAILPKLDAELLGAFYKDGKQRELDEFKKDLRFPKAMGKALPWEMEVPRVVVTLHDKHDAKNDLSISDCVAHKFAFQPKELGVVELEFTVKTKDMTEEQVMHLLRANGQDLPISLVCKPVEEEPDNFEQADLLTQKPLSAGAQDAVKEMAKNLAALETDEPPKVEAAAPAPVVAEPEKPAPRPRRGRAKEVVAPE